MSSVAYELEAVRTTPVIQTMNRERAWVAVDFPDLALEVLPVDLKTTPVVVTVASRRGPVVYRASPCARNAGISMGLAADAAMALCPDLHFYPRDVDAEAKRLGELGQWARRYTPVVSLEFPNAMVIEVSGSFKLFDGRRSLCRRLHEDLKAFGWRYHLALTPTPQASLLLAAGGCEKTVTGKADLRTALGSLSITRLGLGSKLNRQLQNLGISRLYELWRLPRDGLARRLGPDIVRRMDCLLGAHPDPREIESVRLKFERRLEFDAEINDLAQVLSAACSLLAQLSEFLTANDGLTTMINLFLGHVDKGITHLKIGMRHASRDPDYFELLIDEHLQRLPGIDYVRYLRLLCVDIHHVNQGSRDLFAKTDTKDWYQSLDELEARLGRHCLRIPYLAADHRPEHGWRGIDTGLKGIPVKPRPMWLLKSPRRIHQRNGALWHMGLLTITEGPERIENGWWDGNDQCRDYYKAINPAGHQLWIFKDLYQPNHWYLHGLFG